MLKICHQSRFPTSNWNKGKSSWEFRLFFRLIDFHWLKIRCEPVYCSYRMFDQPVHQTDRKSHASDIYWNDVNLCLISKNNSIHSHAVRSQKQLILFYLDLLSDTQLGEFRNSPILNVELHDRDEKASSRRDFASVFGTEHTDDSIARVSGWFLREQFSWKKKVR